MSVRVQEADFDLSTEINAFRAGRRDRGRRRVCRLVRDERGQRRIRPHARTYPAMTQKALEGIVAQATQRWEYSTRW